MALLHRIGARMCAQYTSLIRGPHARALVLQTPQRSAFSVARTRLAVPSTAGRHLNGAARYSSIDGAARWTLPAEALGSCGARRWYSTHPDMPTLNMGGRGLDAVVDVEKMRQVDAEGVKHIWIEHHRTKECLSGVVQQELFTKLCERTLKCPMMVVALPNEQGFLSMLLQVQRNHWLLTPVLEYQEHGADAPPYVTLTFYDELVADKGIALMRGDVCNPSITLQEAQALVNLLQIFYLDDQKYKMVERFNHDPERFSFEEVLAEVKASNAAHAASSSSSPSSSPSSSAAEGSGDAAK